MMKFKDIDKKVAISETLPRVYIGPAVILPDLSDGF
jgi:hypothetical protein